MSTPVRGITRQLVRKSTDRLNILTFGSFPYYDWAFSLLNECQFNLYKGPHIPSEWNTEVLDVPANMSHTIRPDIPINMDIDLILSHNRLQQFELASTFTHYWHIPMCLVHGTMPKELKYNPSWSSILQRRGQSNIYLGAKIQEEWQTPGYVIPPGIPEFDIRNDNRTAVSHIVCSPKEQVVLQNTLDSVQLHFIKKGDFKNTLLFINATTNFYPIHILLAMAHECCVITPNLPELEGLIKHEENGLIYKDVHELRALIAKYKQRPTLCKDMGKKGKALISAQFPLEAFQQKMTAALRSASEVIYTR